MGQTIKLLQPAAVCSTAAYITNMPAVHTSRQYMYISLQYLSEYNDEEEEEVEDEEYGMPGHHGPRTSKRALRKRKASSTCERQTSVGGLCVACSFWFGLTSCFLDCRGAAEGVPYRFLWVGCVRNSPPGWAGKLQFLKEQAEGVHNVPRCSPAATSEPRAAQAAAAGAAAAAP